MQNGRTSNLHNLSCLASFASSKVGSVSGDRIWKFLNLPLLQRLSFCYSICGSESVQANKIFLVLAYFFTKLHVLGPHAMLFWIVLYCIKLTASIGEALESVSC
jgi:hypothetical protein